MFLHLKHHQPDVYKLSSAFVLECYRITRLFPNEEKFGMVSQIRRTALSVHLNIANLTIAESIGYLREKEDLKLLAEPGPRCFQILSKLISVNYAKKE